MKKVLFTWAACIMVSCLVLFGGCAFIKVKGKQFTFMDVKIDYAGNNTPNLAQMENERLNVVNNHKNFILNFQDSGMVSLQTGKTVYYYQDGNEVRLYLNEARTTEYAGENDINLKVRVQQDKVVISYFGIKDTATENYVYTLVFKEKEE